MPLGFLGVRDARVELPLYAIQHAHLLLALKLDRLCRVSEAETSLYTSYINPGFVLKQSWE
jgi:hypothetical protein